MPLAVHCAHCGAPFTAEEMRFCAYCGTERPKEEPEVRHVFAPNAPERWSSAEKHPSFDELMRLSPPDSVLPPALTLRDAILLTVGVILGTYLTADALAKRGTSGSIVASVFLVVAGVIAFGLVARHRALRAAPWQRMLVVVLDKRTELEHRRRSRVLRHFVTLRQRRGSREWRSTEGVYLRLRTGQMGVAYAKENRLLEFRPIPV